LEISFTFLEKSSLSPIFPHLSGHPSPPLPLQPCPLHHFGNLPHFLKKKEEKKNSIGPFLDFSSFSRIEEKKTKKEPDKRGKKDEKREE